ncbi:MAG: FixH family protein [Syntrophaceae bacterium]
MKRFLIATLILLLTTGLAFAKAYEVNKKAGDYSVSITMDKNPPSVGSNNMEIIITDKAGNRVKDAKVLVDYGMPAMPGMPAMAYKADTMSHGNGYHTVLNISMKGPWYVNIKITSQGKTVSTKFTFDVT